jgi:hypothetical protein
MAPRVSVTFLRWMEVFRDAFTRPSFERFKIVSAGWVATTSGHAVTQSLVATGVAGRMHHAAFHRFFSRARWSPDELGRRLFERVVTRWIEAGTPITVVVDDTLAPKKGPRVYGLGTHLDAVRSTRKTRVFTFGHVWVVLAVVVRFPFSSRPWALPVLFRLYRTKKDCDKHADAYSKKTEMARAMLNVVDGWTKHRAVHVVADGAYCNDTVLRDLPERFVMFGAMRPDAALTALPTEAERKRTGRRRKRGVALPSPERLAKDPNVPWNELTATTYGRTRTISFKTIDAQWYRACGTRLVRAVVVHETTGKIGIRVFFCTDPTASPTRILETYALRWGIEVCFRDLKQHFGFAASSARTPNAVERTAPFVGIVSSCVVLVAAEAHATKQQDAVPLRPWYRHKRGLSFEDALRVVRADLWERRVLDPVHDFGNLRKPSRGRVGARKSTDTAA